MNYYIKAKDTVVKMNTEEIMQYMTYRLSNDYIVSIQAFETIKGIYKYEKLAYKEISLYEFKEAIEEVIHAYHHIDFYKI